MRLRRSWKTLGINRCRSAQRGVSTLWVCSQWWAHILPHLFISDPPASTNNPLTILPCSSGFFGSRNRGYHEEGTSDGWPRCRRAKVLFFDHLWVNEWLPTTKCLGLMQTSRQNNLYFFNTLSRLQPKRVFQTVKNLNLMRQQRLSLAPSPLNIPGSNQTSCLTSGRSSRVGTPRSNSIYGGEVGSGIILDNRTSSILESPDDG